MSALGAPGVPNYDATAQSTGAGSGLAYTETTTGTVNKQTTTEQNVANEDSITGSNNSERPKSSASSHSSAKPATDKIKEIEAAEFMPIHGAGSGPTPQASSELSGKKTSDMDSDVSEEQQRRDSEVHELAHQLSRRTTNHSMATIKQSPFTGERNPALDPSSDQFSAKAWVKSLLYIQSRDPEKYPKRTAGVAFRNLNVYGFGTATDYQKTVGNVLVDVVGTARSILGSGKRRIDILQDFDGVVEAGEMLVVLGPPGSGCSTLLKTIAGETHGLNIDPKSHLNYQGISAEQMHKDFRGEAIYTAEVDVHFPNLTVGETLLFASLARAPRHIPEGITRVEYATHVRDVTMAMLGISHTLNTNVGNDYVRGVSGGERKRVTIAEATLSGAPLQCWDNSTRGLDSANAIEFCRNLRMATQMQGTTACVAIYQSPQSAYDLFDKVTVLYEGRQIYFGRADAAKKYFIDLGFDCPDRQTTADFLTSMTSPLERVIRKGFENQAPRSPDEFAARWKESEDRKRLLEEIEAFDQKYKVGGEYLEKFKVSRRAQQAKRQRVKSPYTLSYTQQVKLCLWRGFKRLFSDPTITLTALISNSIMGLVISSVFYNLQPNTGSFYSRGALLFFAVLVNAFGSALEILTLYAQRPIVEKHSRYALYHPSAEAFASMLTDIPYKILNATFFNLVLYFMTNLRREPGAFFFFLLVSFAMTLTMSMLFRTIASLSRSLSQAMPVTSVLILGIIMYSGFTIPIDYMLGWARWINYVNPVAYGFECLMINEFHNRDFPCVNLIPFGPGYENISGENRVCTMVGSRPGSLTVNGDAYINSSFQYYHSHKWRNVGIIFAFMFALLGTYLAAAEYITAKKSKGEVLVFRKGQLPATLKNGGSDVEQTGGVAKASEVEKAHQETAMIQRQTAIFQWKDVCFDIKIKKETRRILDNVDGWVKPGTLTALMGVSGAGKTTLLDVLASRVTMGVISGEMLVDGRQRDESFQRKTGYVQQQDLHLETSTVREALNFSAILRQPAHIPRTEKIAYVDEVIKLLDMQEYADAVVGVPGEGLNVEQRKRLTIGVELAAKPQLLLFLDEPTSGLDSQTSWAICDLMEKLANAGQAILCTIHQPSAMLFQRFDRLLFLAKGGQTVYFGEIGENSKTLTSYFEKNGASACPAEANPAEWMLEVIGAAPGTSTDIDWFQVWRNSPEYQTVQAELSQLKDERSKIEQPANTKENKASYRPFAAHFSVQFFEVTKRVFEQYWRTPTYIYSKFSLCTLTGLFIGFSFFQAENTQQGLQNQMFSLFMLMTIFGQFAQQIMPLFVTQRALYEARERPSKAYSWVGFMLANIFAEIPWNTLMAFFVYATWYYPSGVYRNAELTGATSERSGLMFLIIWIFLLFASTFTAMVIAGVDSAETGGNLANLVFSLSLIFCGVLASPDVLPGFWIFMYRVSPFNYLVSGMLSTAVANSRVVCAANEYIRFNPTNGSTCGEYMDSYIRSFGGYLQDRSSRDSCSFCQQDDTNTFLALVHAPYSEAWRNFGLMWVYVIFNIFAALGLYYLIRVPKNNFKKDKKKKE